MAKGTQKFRCPNWSHEETLVLAELKKDTFLRKKEGRLVWEQIAQTISSRFPEQKRSLDQCRRRWETLTKIYNHIEKYCIVTGQDHVELDEDELRSMKLDTAYRQDWYNIVKEVCSQRKRKEKDDCDLIAVKRSKRSYLYDCSFPSSVLAEPTYLPGSDSLYVTLPASDCEQVTTTTVDGQISTRPSSEAEKLKLEEENRRLHTMLREKEIALILALEQLQQRGQVAQQDQVPHNSPAEVRAQCVKEPLLQDAVMDHREAMVEHPSKAAEQDGIDCELMVARSRSLSPEFFSDGQHLGGYIQDPFYSFADFSFASTESLELESYPWIYGISWKAEGTNALGETAAAEYTMLHPSGGIAYFHLLLVASGSTWERVKTGDKKRVYKHLLKNFEQLVEYGDTLRPHDIIYVWNFNKRTQLLCRVEGKDFHAQLETIRAAYRKEFDGTNYKETRLYDAIAKVMVKIREDYKDYKQADFFLVPFTVGEDFGSETASLNGMVEEINSVGGRLHTFFITANMPPTSGLYKRLQSQQNEITLVDCEKSEPNEISRAFNTLRELIKSYLWYSTGEAVRST